MTTIYANSNNKNRQVYIVLSQTGTLLSQVLKALTGAQYNHSSIALDKHIETMYSFGRKDPYIFWDGAFVRESPRYGTFYRFRKTEVQVLALNVTELQYRIIENRIENMWQAKEKYGYNYWGLLLAAFRTNRKNHHRFYCSEFVAHILEASGVVAQGTFGKVVKPIDFQALPGTRVVYQGKLQEYSKNRTSA